MLSTFNEMEKKGRGWWGVGSCAGNETKQKKEKKHKVIKRVRKAW